MLQHCNYANRVFSGFFFLLLFFVVHIPLSLTENTAYSSKWGNQITATRFHISKKNIGGRNLAEALEKVKKFFFGNILYDDEPVKYPPEPRKKDVFKKKVKNYSIEARLAPKIYFTPTGSVIFTNKKKAAIEYYYFNENQKKKYNEFVEALWEAFHEEAKRIGLSDHERMNLLSSVYPLISKDSSTLEEYWEKRFLLLLKRRVIWLLQFESLLRECNNSWNKLIKKNEKKWIEILTDKLRKYNMGKKKKEKPSTEENEYEIYGKMDKLKRFLDKISIDIYNT
ncbi:RAD protein (Pv-fam-e) [Plasmodium vivax Brazil I]|uniref:RAD protein (Pv-fam-e) n=1 Tax=Plasmodium vivax (strain Brazil I) TaxID=1033975 RepID=A0A0J9VMB3_PLAV1|nr:RAD protein (Pv-fam-e) [Plasmodium vivax Brazil I]